MSKPHLLCLNGSLRGPMGNTARIIEHVRAWAAGRADVTELCLAQAPLTPQELEQHLRRADAFVACSGVYWNSHGSVMQRFLEVVTAWEATDVFLSKPAGVVLSMDSVGGMEVAARLASVLNLFGCAIVPLGMAVLSRVGQAAWETAPQQDVYALGDVQLLVDNLIAAAAAPKPSSRLWDVKPTRLPPKGYHAPGLLDVDTAPWLHAPA